MGVSGYRGGATDRTVRDRIPVGSMIIANGMQASSLALDRFSSDISPRRAKRPRGAHSDGRFAPEPRVGVDPGDDHVRGKPDLRRAVPVRGHGDDLRRRGAVESLCSLLVRRIAFTDTKQLKRFDSDAA